MPLSDSFHTTYRSPLAIAVTARQYQVITTTLMPDRDFRLLPEQGASGLPSNGFRVRGFGLPRAAFQVPAPFDSNHFRVVDLPGTPEEQGKSPAAFPL